MNLKKWFRKKVFSKWNIGLAVHATCLVSSLVASEQVAGREKLNATSYNKIQFKDALKPNYKLGYEVEIMSNRKLAFTKEDSRFSFSKSKGNFHGPKLEISGEPISGFFKLGMTNYSFRDSKLGNYKGFGFGIGGNATVYNQDDLSIAIELAFFGGRATIKGPKAFTQQGSKLSTSDSSNNSSDKVIPIPILVAPAIEAGGGKISANGVLINFPEVASGSMDGKLRDKNGNIIGYRGKNNQWFIYESAVQNQQEETQHPTAAICTPKLAKMTQSRLDARVVVKKQMEDFSPYFGLGYTADRSTFSEKGKKIDEGRKLILKAVNKNKIGPFLGCKFVKNDKLTLGFEAQLLNQNSFKFSGSYCF